MPRRGYLFVAKDDVIGSYMPRRGYPLREIRNMELRIINEEVEEQRKCKI